MFEALQQFVRDNEMLSVHIGLFACIMLGIVFIIVCVKDDKKAEPVNLNAVGNITAETLSLYDGRHPYRQILVAVQGKIYDVTKSRDMYGPDGGYHVFAGKECSRALAMMTINKEDCCDDLQGCTENDLNTLKDWVKKFDEKYEVVGKVIPSHNLTLKELQAYDGSDPKKPIYLAIKNRIFDVSKGKEYYGPDGVYPFAGKQVARAFAKHSTDEKDCNADLTGLTIAERDALAEWECKFEDKYPIVGLLLDS